jgi:hypothetical protein
LKGLIYIELSGWSKFVIVKGILKLKTLIMEDILKFDMVVALVHTALHV